MAWGLLPVLVRGPSMAPTLRHGDAVLARRGGRPVRPGDVVVARFRSRPELLVIKRAVRIDQGGWWLEGDNPVVADDLSAQAETTQAASGTLSIVGVVWSARSTVSGVSANSTGPTMSPE